MTNSMSAFYQFVFALLEREAGYHLMSFSLIVLGVLLIEPVKRAEIAHDLITFGLGVMARSMGSKKPDPPPGSVTVERKTETTITPPEGK